MTRSLVRCVFRVWIGVLVAAQFAVAAHACAGLAGNQAGSGAGRTVEWRSDARALASKATQATIGTIATIATVATMVDCDDGDSADAFAGAPVCAEHCRMGQQADHSASIAIATTAPFSAQYVLPDRPAAATPSRLTAASTLSALVAAAPCHAILHCVRRT